jgi:hypothetical protein
MNRHERRAAKALSRTVEIDRVVAVHEAGHAVARVLTASDLGLSSEEAISHIELGIGNSMGKSKDGKMQLMSEAVTFGPRLSKDIAAAFKRIAAGVPPDQIDRQHITDAVSLARSEGADIEKWLRAKMLIAVFGSAAEAKYTDKTIEDVWTSYAAEADRRDAFSEGVLAGLSTSDIEVLIEDAIRRAKVLIEHPQIQSAIHALADGLPNSGKLPGKRAVHIIAQVLFHKPIDPSDVSGKVRLLNEF